MNRSQKIVIISGILLIILTFLLPPWHTYSRQRTTPWIAALDKLPWSPYGSWQFWQSENTAVTGATPVYEFFFRHDLLYPAPEEIHRRQQVRPDPNTPFRLIEVQKMFSLDLSRFIAQIGLILILTALFYRIFHPRKSLYASLEPIKKIWGDWGI